MLGLRNKRSSIFSCCGVKVKATTICASTSQRTITSQRSLGHIHPYHSQNSLDPALPSSSSSTHTARSFITDLIPFALLSISAFTMSQPRQHHVPDLNQQPEYPGNAMVPTGAAGGNAAHPGFSHPVTSHPGNNSHIPPNLPYGPHQWPIYPPVHDPRAAPYPLPPPGPVAMYPGGATSVNSLHNSTGMYPSGQNMIPITFLPAVYVAPHGNVFGRVPVNFVSPDGHVVPYPPPYSHSAQANNMLSHGTSHLSLRDHPQSQHPGGGRSDGFASGANPHNSRPSLPPQSGMTSAAGPGQNTPRAPERPATRLSRLIPTAEPFQPRSMTITTSEAARQFERAAAQERVRPMIPAVSGQPSGEDARMTGALGSPSRYASEVYLPDSQVSSEVPQIPQMPTSVAPHPDDEQVFSRYPGLIRPVGPFRDNTNTLNTANTSLRRETLAQSLMRAAREARGRCRDDYAVDPEGRERRTSVQRGSELRQAQASADQHRNDTANPNNPPQQGVPLNPHIPGYQMGGPDFARQARVIMGQTWGPPQWGYNEGALYNANYVPFIPQNPVIGPSLDDNHPPRTAMNLPAMHYPPSYGPPHSLAPITQPYMYDPPPYDPPPYGPPSYGPPSYGPPSYGAPSYGPPSYGPPHPLTPIIQPATDPPSYSLDIPQTPINQSATHDTLPYNPALPQTPIYRSATDPPRYGPVILQTPIDRSATDPPPYGPAILQTPVNRLILNDHRTPLPMSPGRERPSSRAEESDQSDGGVPHLERHVVYTTSIESQNTDSGNSGVPTYTPYHPNLHGNETSNSAQSGLSGSHTAISSVNGNQGPPLTNGIHGLSLTDGDQDSPLTNGDHDPPLTNGTH